MTDRMTSTAEVSQRLARIEEMLAYQAQTFAEIKRRILAIEQRQAATEDKTSMLAAYVEYFTAKGPIEK